MTLEEYIEKRRERVANMTLAQARDLIAKSLSHSDMELEFDKAVQMLLDCAEEKINNDWIPVTERLPEYNKEVLTCSDGGFIEIQSLENSCNGAYWEDQEGDWSYSGEVTAWMPLPQPYKAESEEE